MDVLILDSRLLRAAATRLAPSLTHLLNVLKLNLGLFLLIGNLLESPLFIKARALPGTDNGNYRPISVLSYVCNIMENKIKAQILKYFI